MKYVLSPDEMRDLEKAHLELSGEPSINLMERAAREIVYVLTGRLGGAEGKTVVFACGPGNNGGDGYAAARLFADGGGRAVVLPIFPVERLKGDARTNAERAHAHSGVFFARLDRLGSMPRPDAWVDAIFGIGLAREVGDPYAKVMERMAADRAQGSTVLAVDIASGLEGFTGRTLGVSVRADVTVTFQYAKYGHYFGDGMDKSGEVAVRPIGISEALPPQGSARLMEPQDLRALWRPRRRNSHKGDYGHLLIVAGSAGMAGAALIAAQAALHSGAGLVTVACAQSIVPILQTGAPSAMCVPLPEENGAIAESAVSALEAALKNKTALAVGPGLSTRASAEAIRFLLACGLPGVFDADALNLIARPDGEGAVCDLKTLLAPHHVMTPHPGEAARLLGGVTGNPLEDARALRALGATALYKGAATVVYGDAPTISISGTSGMAKGGSGDVLTGLLGGFLAQGIPPETAACLATEIHGLAGECAARVKGDVYMTALDLIDGLSEVFKHVERGCI